MWRFLQRLWWRPEIDPQRASLLSNQPCEILLLVLDHLPSESSAAFSLTCKLHYHSFFARAKRYLDDQSRQNLLLLLEPSLSRKLFYCHECIKLHRYSSYWNPGIQSYGLSCSPSTTEFRKPFFLARQLRFHHVRLAMNAHLLGPGHGLDLARLALELQPCWNQRWQADSTARIIHGEIFLGVNHRLFLQDEKPEVVQYSVSSIFNHNICSHITTHLPMRNPFDLHAMQPMQLPQLWPLYNRYPDDDVTQDNCTDVAGSCPVCLTDFAVSVERQKTRPYNDGTYLQSLNIEIKSHHQLGSCRSPLDWKWQTFSLPCADVGRSLPESQVRIHQKETCCRTGAVRRQWEEASLSVIRVQGCGIV